MSNSVKIPNKSDNIENIDVITNNTEDITSVDVIASEPENITCNSDTSPSKSDDLLTAKKTKDVATPENFTNTADRNICGTVPKKRNFDKITIFWFSLLAVAIVSLIILALTFCIHTNKNMNSNFFANGVTVHGIDVSQMTFDEAKSTVETFILSNTPEYLTLVHDDFETMIPVSSLEISYDVDKALTEAFAYGKSGEFMENGLDLCYSLIKVQNFTVDSTLGRQILFDALEDISSKLPTAVIESSHYIEDNELLLYPGSPGNVVNSKSMFTMLENDIRDVTLSANPIRVMTLIADPTPLDIDEIYSDVYSNSQNASYTSDPYSFTPSASGIDFAISIDDAKELLTSEKTEYVVPLKVLEPEIDNSDIGMAAFPDQLSTYKTYYNSYQTARTTNVRLSGEKVNGAVIMPGETFSYNNVVGARTIAAGYQNAPMYVNGEVVDGLGGGICQTTSTLYNAAIYANLDITTRSNHTFIPSYVTASRDATVVYGLIDFEFVNNRDYPIKIVCTVSGGVQTISIHGLSTPDDYDVEISSYQTGSSSTHIYSSCYKILKKNGIVIDKVLLSKDVYKKY